jgi:hypothetical protein
MMIGSLRQELSSEGWASGQGYMLDVDLVARFLKSSTVSP